MQKTTQALLRSANPKDRIRGIKQAIQNPDANVRQLLTSIAEKDSNSEVRGYAKRVAQKLTAQETGKTVNSLQEANFFLDEANNAMFAGEVTDARTFARRAFQLAPQLQHDDLARDVAVYVMKMNADEAIELLLSDRDLFEADIAFRKKIGYHYSDEDWWFRFKKHFRKWDVTWQDAGIDVGLYLLATTLPAMILLILSSGVLERSFELMSGERLRGLAALIENYVSLSEYNIWFLVFTAIMTGIGFFITFAFHMLLAHVSANWVFGGDGSLRRLIHHAFITVTIYSNYVWLLIFITPILYNIGLGSLVFSGLIEILNMLGFGIFVYTLSGIIGRAYQFDLGRGCLSLAFPITSFICFILTVLSMGVGRVIIFGVN